MDSADIRELAASGDHKRALKECERALERFKKARDAAGLRDLRIVLHDIGADLPEKHQRRHEDLVYAISQNLKFLDAASNTATASVETKSSDRSRSDHTDPLYAPTKKLRIARAQYSRRIEAAASAVRAAQKAYYARVQAASASLAGVEQGSPLRKQRRRAKYKDIVLYETDIVVGKARFPITPETRARFEQQGLVQSVQGWVFKSDQDRREAYLSIEGAGWSRVYRADIPWHMRGGSYGGKVFEVFGEMREFASAVNAAAAYVQGLQPTKARAMDEGRAQVERARADTGAVDAARAALADAHKQTADMEQAAAEVSLLLEGRSDETMLVRDARREVARAARASGERGSSSVSEFVLEVGQAVDDLKAFDPMADLRDKRTELKQSLENLKSFDLKAELNERATEVKNDLRDRFLRPLRGHLPPNQRTASEMRDPGRPEPAPDLDESTVVEHEASDLEADLAAEAAADRPPGRPPSSGDVVEQIRQLAALRDDGLISSEEFEEKKLDLLSRL